MADVNLEGLGVALVTPFKKNFSIDFDALGDLIDHVIEGGCDYLVALGTTAENPTLNPDEKAELIEFIKYKTRYRKPIVIGIGGNNTSAVKTEIENINPSGLSAILSVTPFYNKPSQEGLFQHYKILSESSPLPLILYNVPGRTGVNLSAVTTIKLSHECNNIAAIKEASGNIEQSREIMRKCRPGFIVISGDDGYTWELINNGAKGVISVLANAMPAKVKNLVKLSLEGDSDWAEKLQKDLQPLIRHLFEDGNPAGVKAVLHKMGMAENVLRLPLVAVNSELEEKIEQEIKRLRS